MQSWSENPIETIKPQISISIRKIFAKNVKFISWIIWIWHTDTDVTEWVDHSITLLNSLCLTRAPVLQVHWKLPLSHPHYKQTCGVRWHVGINAHHMTAALKGYATCAFTRAYTILMTLTESTDMLLRQTPLTVAQRKYLTGNNSSQEASPRVVRPLPVTQKLLRGEESKSTNMFLRERYEVLLVNLIRYTTDDVKNFPRCSI